MRTAAIRRLLCLLLICSFLPCKDSLSSYHPPHLSPVIFVPGLGGSQIEAQLHKSVVPSFVCYYNAPWYTIWLDVKQLVYPWLQCWIDNLKLHYDRLTRTTHNSPGVDIRVAGWPWPEAVEWVDPTKGSYGAYFNVIGETLRGMGYISIKNLFSAPYDFRKSPNENTQFFKDLKDLVEDAYERNYKTPVTFIAHSMGSTMMLVFLQQQTYEWKQKYVRRLISLSGVWGGSAKALKTFAMGDDLDSFFIPNKNIREIEITCPSLSWLLPSPLFWKPNQALIETPGRSYTVTQLAEFFEALGQKDGWEMRKDNLRYSLTFSPPDVDLHCFYGDGIDTMEKLIYSSNDVANTQPVIAMGPGDGTVNRRSLSACESWMGYTKSNVTSKPLKNISHMGILSDKRILNYIKQILQS